MYGHSLSVRKVLQYSSEVEDVEADEVEKKLKLYDRLGDLCCSLRAYTAAVKFYGQQVRLCYSHRKVYMCGLTTLSLSLSLSVPFFLHGSLIWPQLKAESQQNSHQSTSL